MSTETIPNMEIFYIIFHVFVTFIDIVMYGHETERTMVVDYQKHFKV